MAEVSYTFNVCKSSKITDSFGRLQYKCNTNIDALREEIELKGDKIQIGLFNLLDLAESGK